MRAFVVLGLVISVSSQEIGLGKRLENDLLCVEWYVKPKLDQSVKWCVWLLWSCVVDDTVVETLAERLEDVGIDEVDWVFWRTASSLWCRDVALSLGMWRSQLKSASVGFGFCVSDPSDSVVGTDLLRDHSLFCWIAIYQCLCILNTEPDDISRSHSAFNVIQTSRDSYSMCICLLWHGKQRTAMNDEWELYATNGKSESDVNESVNPSDLLEIDSDNIRIRIRTLSNIIIGRWASALSSRCSDWLMYQSYFCVVCQFVPSVAFPGQSGKLADDSFVVRPPSVCREGAQYKYLCYIDGLMHSTVQYVGCWN